MTSGKSSTLLRLMILAAVGTLALGVAGCDRGADKGKSGPGSTAPGGGMTKQDPSTPPGPPPTTTPPASSTPPATTPSPEPEPKKP
jgi:hypothetical protein